MRAKNSSTGCSGPNSETTRQNRSNVIVSSNESHNTALKHFKWIFLMREKSSLRHSMNTFSKSWYSTLVFLGSKDCLEENDALVQIQCNYEARDTYTSDLATPQTLDDLLAHIVRTQHVSHDLLVLLQDLREVRTLVGVLVPTQRQQLLQAHGPIRFQRRTEACQHVSRQLFFSFYGREQLLQTD